jgi:haloacid dehalogenase-like hydrolase
MAGKQDVPNAVRLVVADVDGTLVTPDKILTPRARAVVRTIIEAGIAFTITSGRPPLGMKTLIDDLDLQEPVTALRKQWNGLFFEVRPPEVRGRQKQNVFLGTGRIVHALRGSLVLG